MVYTRTTREPSPAPSDSSDALWEQLDEDHRVSVSPAPSQTADPYEWDSDTSAGPLDSTNATPTPQAARLSSPASVTEISREDFPALETRLPVTPAKTKAKKGKAKGKKKAPAGTCTVQCSIQSL